MRVWDSFLESAFIFTVLAAALPLADRLAFELGIARPHLSRTPLVVALLGGSIALSLLATGILAWRFRVAPARVAWQADRFLDTDALFLSAVEIAENKSSTGFESLVLEQAGRESERIDPKQVVPAPPVRYRWAIVLALAAGAALLILPPNPAPAPIADFSVEPVRGNAPFDVVFREACIGYVDTYEWDFRTGTLTRPAAD